MNCECGEIINDKSIEIKGIQYCHQDCPLLILCYCNNYYHRYKDGVMIYYREPDYCGYDCPLLKQCECGKYYNINNEYKASDYYDNKYCSQDCELLEMCNRCCESFRTDSEIEYLSINKLKFCSEFCRDKYEHKQNLCNCFSPDEYAKGFDAIKKCDYCYCDHFYNDHYYKNFKLNEKNFCSNKCQNKFTKFKNL